MSRPGGLGRGLGALIPSAGPGESGLLTLDLSALVPNPRQPRTDFDAAALEELAQSIGQIGMLQPILVRPSGDGRYEIIAGERRYRAARLAGMQRVPAVVRQTADDQILTEALVENIHRADLNPLEEAAAYDQLLGDFGMTHEALATRLGKSRSAITNALRLLGLPTAVQHRVLAGTLTAGHARALLGVDDPGLQEQLAERVAAEELSVRATEELVRDVVALGHHDGSGNGAVTQDEDERGAMTPPRRGPFLGLERRIGEALSTRVQIKGTSRRGKLVIDYAGQEDLERLLDILGKGTGTELVQE